MSFLEGLKAEKKKREAHRIFYGKPGDGKTSLVVQFPKSGMISAASDRGAEDLRSNGLIAEDYPIFVVHNWTQLRQALQEWAKAPPFGTLNLDNLTEFQSYCRLHILNTRFNSDEAAFNKYNDGMKQVAAEWECLLNDIDTCRDNGVKVNSIAHARSAKVDDPKLGTYDSWMPDLFDGDRKDAPSLLRPTVNRASDILFLYRDVSIDKGKAKGENNGKRRMLQTQANSSAVAKNRNDLDSPIDLGDQGAKSAFELLTAAYRAAAQKAKS